MESDSSDEREAHGRRENLNEAFDPRFLASSDSNLSSRSWLTPSYGEVVDESDLDLFHVRVRERAELAPPEDTRLVVAQLARLTAAMASMPSGPATSSRTSQSSHGNTLEAILPWYDNFDYLDRLRRVILHDLDALAATAEEEDGDVVCDYVLPFACAALKDRRVSLARNSIEALSDLFYAWGHNVRSTTCVEYPLSVLLDLQGGGAAKSLKEAASKALDQAVVCVPARHLVPPLCPFASHRHKQVQQAALKAVASSLALLMKDAAAAAASSPEGRRYHRRRRRRGQWSCMNAGLPEMLLPPEEDADTDGDDSSGDECGGREQENEEEDDDDGDIVKFALRSWCAQDDVRSVVGALLPALVVGLKGAKASAAAKQSARVCAHMLGACLGPDLLKIAVEGNRKVGKSDQAVLLDAGGASSLTPGGGSSRHDLPPPGFTWPSSGAELAALASFSSSSASSSSFLPLQPARQLSQPNSSSSSSPPPTPSPDQRQRAHVRSSSSRQERKSVGASPHEDDDDDDVPSGGVDGSQRSRSQSLPPAPSSSLALRGTSSGAVMERADKQQQQQQRLFRQHQQSRGRQTPVAQKSAASPASNHSDGYVEPTSSPPVSASHLRPVVKSSTCAATGPAAKAVPAAHQANEHRRASRSSSPRAKMKKTTTTTTPAAGLDASGGGGGSSGGSSRASSSGVASKPVVRGRAPTSNSGYDSNGRRIVKDGSAAQKSRSKSAAPASTASESVGGVDGNGKNDDASVAPVVASGSGKTLAEKERAAEKQAEKAAGNSSRTSAPTSGDARGRRRAASASSALRRPQRSSSVSSSSGRGESVKKSAAASIPSYADLVKMKDPTPSLEQEPTAKISLTDRGGPDARVGTEMERVGNNGFRSLASGGTKQPEHARSTFSSGTSVGVNENDSTRGNFSVGGQTKSRRSRSDGLIGEQSVRRLSRVSSGSSKGDRVVTDEDEDDGADTQEGDAEYAASLVQRAKEKATRRLQVRQVQQETQPHDQTKPLPEDRQAAASATPPPLVPRAILTPSSTLSTLSTHSARSQPGLLVPTPQSIRTNTISSASSSSSSSSWLSAPNPLPLSSEVSLKSASSASQPASRSPPSSEPEDHPVRSLTAMRRQNNEETELGAHRHQAQVAPPSPSSSPVSSQKKPSAPAPASISLSASSSSSTSSFVGLAQVLPVSSTTSPRHHPAPDARRRPPSTSFSSSSSDRSSSSRVATARVAGSASTSSAASSQKGVPIAGRRFTTSPRHVMPPLKAVQASERTSSNHSSRACKSEPTERSDSSDLNYDESGSGEVQGEETVLVVEEDEDDHHGGGFESRHGNKPQNEEEDGGGDDDSDDDEGEGTDKRGWKEEEINDGELSDDQSGMGMLHEMMQKASETSHRMSAVGSGVEDNDGADHEEDEEGDAVDNAELLLSAAVSHDVLEERAANRENEEGEDGGGGGHDLIDGDDEDCHSDNREGAKTAGGDNPVEEDESQLNRRPLDIDRVTTGGPNAASNGVLSKPPAPYKRLWVPRSVPVGRHADLAAARLPSHSHVSAESPSPSSQSQTKEEDKEHAEEVKESSGTHDPMTAEPPEYSVAVNVASVIPSGQCSNGCDLGADTGGDHGDREKAALTSLATNDDQLARGDGDAEGEEKEGHAEETSSSRASSRDSISRMTPVCSVETGASLSPRSIDTSHSTKEESTQDARVDPEPAVYSMAPSRTLAAAYELDDKRLEQLDEHRSSAFEVALTVALYDVGGVDSFGGEARETFRLTLAHSLSVDVSQVSILGVRAGSVLVDVNIRSLRSQEQASSLARALSGLGQTETNASTDPESSPRGEARAFESGVSWSPQSNDHEPQHMHRHDHALQGAVERAGLGRCALVSLPTVSKSRDSSLSAFPPPSSIASSTDGTEQALSNPLRGALQPTEHSPIDPQSLIADVPSTFKDKSPETDGISGQVKADCEHAESNIAVSASQACLDEGEIGHGERAGNVLVGAEGRALDRNLDEGEAGADDRAEGAGNFDETAPPEVTAAEENEEAERNERQAADLEQEVPPHEGAEAISTPRVVVTVSSSQYSFGDDGGGAGAGVDTESEEALEANPAGVTVDDVGFQVSEGEVGAEQEHAETGSQVTRESPRPRKACCIIS